MIFDIYYQFFKDVAWARLSSCTIFFFDWKKKKYTQGNSKKSLIQQSKDKPTQEKEKKICQ